MIYLLDTNVCVLLIRQKSQSVLARLLTHPVTDVGVSAITVAELQYGVQKSGRPIANQQALDRFLLPLATLPFDDTAAAAYGSIRVGLESQGLPIGSLDMLIAAQAIGHRLTLVTNNGREFSPIPGLTIEDWTSPPDPADKRKPSLGIASCTNPRSSAWFSATTIWSTGNNIASRAGESTPPGTAWMSS